MYEQRLPIEEWKAKKQAELKETIAAQKSVLQEVVQDGQRLANYLYGRGRLGSHITSGNAALVLQTLPQARAVLTAKDWDKFGRRVNKGAKGIPQLVRVNGYYNVGSIFDVSMTYGNKPYPIPEIKPEQMDKAIKELERLSPVNIIFQNEGVVGYDAERHAIVFPTAMLQREVLARLPAEIVIATAEQHTPGISQAPYLSKILGKETERTKSQSIGKGSRGSSSDSLQTAGRELCMPDEIRRMRDDECLLLMRSEDPVIDKKYNLLHHPNVKYTPDAGGEPYVMPPDYMGDAVTITMGAVAAATAPEITEEMYEQLDYLEKHPEENYYENEENFSQYDQGD